MNVALCYRPPEVHEVEVLSELAFSAKSAWGYPEAWLDLWKDALTVTAEDLAKDWYLCAVKGERILGFCGLSVENDAAEIEHLWVLPDCMGQGLGRALIEKALAHLRFLGAASVKIVSDPHAVDFYRKFGAYQIGEEPSAPEGRRLPVLRLDLVTTGDRPEASP